MKRNRVIQQSGLNFLVPGFMAIFANRLLLLAAMLTFTPSGWAEDFHIAAGDVFGLHDAVAASNTNDEPDTIYLAAGTYAISDNIPELYWDFFTISSPVSIRGSGSAQTVIERKDTFRHHFFFVDAEGELMLSDVTLTGGYENKDCGGAIQVVGGKLTVEHSTFSDNYSTFSGGALCVQGGNVTIRHGLFTGNKNQNGGGAIKIFQSATMSVEKSVFRENKTDAYGGAILNDRSTLLVSESIITLNSARSGGGVSSDATGGSTSNIIDIVDSTISNNTASLDGGGLFLHSGTASITGSTISSNFAGRDGGGLMTAYGSKSITNSTISGNLAAGSGGGIASFGSVAIDNATIAFNSADHDADEIGDGGGIYGPKTVVSNTIIAGNRVGGEASECFGTVQSRGRNLLQVLTEGCEYFGSADLIGEDPLLERLTNNGGFTDTHALAPGSPAIDAFPNICYEPDQKKYTDQRGVPRKCAIGAYEVGMLPPNPDFQINAGLNDAWFNPESAGQGFLITVFPAIRQVFLAWFTYDLERPDLSTPAHIGEAGHRWLTAQGPYADSQATLDLHVTAGGLFDSPAPKPTTVQYGNIIVELSSCNRGTITYNLPSVNRQGVIPIQRIDVSNVRLCEALEEQRHQR